MWVIVIVNLQKNEIEIELLRRVYPFIPSINIQILQTGLYTFL